MIPMIARPPCNRRSGITIAIPNWNHEMVLPRAIRSALLAVMQLRKCGIDADILVIDDGSRDGSPTLLRQLEAIYCASGLRVILGEVNRGLAYTRNAALAEAAFRYVLFMDADNELVPENVPTFYKAILQTGAAIVYGNLLTKRDGQPGSATLSNESFQHRAFESNYIDAFAVVDALQLCDLGNYLDDSRVRAREDWELILHLACNGREIIYVPVVLGYYHDVPGSMIKEATQLHTKQSAHIRRVFDQLNIRRHLPPRTLHRRYHPDIGSI